MFNGIFDSLLFWHWWIFAVILLILEIFTPGAFFMWMGISAGVTGFLLLLIPDLSWQIQFVLFAISSIAAIILGRYFFGREEKAQDDPTIGQLESELLGKRVKVEQEIINGTGRVRVGESTWKAVGEDAKVGEIVEVVAVNGAELVVRNS